MRAVIKNEKQKEEETFLRNVLLFGLASFTGSIVIQILTKEFSSVAETIGAGALPFIIAVSFTLRSKEGLIKGLIIITVILYISNYEKIEKINNGKDESSYGESSRILIQTEDGGKWITESPPKEVVWDKEDLKLAVEMRSNLSMRLDVLHFLLSSIPNEAARNEGLKMLEEIAFDPSRFSEFYETIRDEYSKRNFGGVGVGDDAAFFKKMKEHGYPFKEGKH